jgi:hypothetical protein
VVFVVGMEFAAPSKVRMKEVCQDNFIKLKMGAWCKMILYLNIKIFDMAKYPRMQLYPNYTMTHKRSKGWKEKG